MEERTTQRAYRLAERVIPFLASVLIRVIGSTIRLRVLGLENLEAARRLGEPVIYAFWHNRLFLLCYTHRGKAIHALVSQSRDGELIARTLGMFGLSAVRGSSSAGGARALLELVRCVTEGVGVAVTPDGPQGPRYRVQAGVVQLARRTGCPIVPVAWDVTRRLALPSWDGFLLPIPFSRGVVIYGKPLVLAPDSGKEAVAEKQVELQSELVEITGRATAYAHARPSGAPFWMKLGPVVDGSRNDLAARAARKVLVLGSLIYRVLLEFTLTMYRWGILRQKRAPCCVISVGNLVIGGSGKTPLVEHLARRLSARGRNVAIVSRGYGRLGRRPVAIVSDGERILLNGRLGGDEAVLLAKNLPGIPVIVGRDRWRAAELARKLWATDTVILDDGYQHWSLARDLDIVTVPSRGFGPGGLVPCGWLREPIEHLSRADLVCLVRSLRDVHLGGLRDVVGRYARRAPVIEMAVKPLCLEEIPPGKRLEVGELKRLRVLALSSIADPRPFEELIAELGARVLECVRYPDHHPYTGEDGDRIVARARACGATAIVTTQKDSVRLPPWLQSDIRLLALVIRMEPLEGEEVLEGLLSRALESWGKS